MGRASLLAVPLLAALGAGGWFLFGRETGSKPILLDDVATGVEEEKTPDAVDLRAGPRSLVVGGASSAAVSPYRIQGVVIDEKGKAVVDVTVRAHTYGKMRDPDDVASWVDPRADDPVRKEFAGIDDPKVVDGTNDPSATSDKDGRFELTVPEAGNYEVAALPVAGRVGVKNWSNPTKEKPVAHVTVRLLGGQALAGRVVDVEGKGVVSFVSGSFTPALSDNPWMNMVDVPSTATDPTGAFVLAAVPDGKGTLTVKVAGRGTFTGFSVTTPAKDPVTLTIGAAGVIKGRVTDAAGQAIAGADVSIMTSAAKPPPAGTPRGSTVRGKTQPDGSYRIEGVVPGLVKRAAVAATGYTSLAQSPPGAKWSGADVKEGVEANLDLVLLRGGTVVGRVVDKTDKAAEAPVTNAEVFLLGPTGTASGVVAQSAPRVTAVDKDGGFKFEDVPLGKYVLYARSPSHYLPVDGAGNQSFQNGRVMRMNVPGGGGSPTTTTLVLTKEGETFEKNLLMLKGLPVAGIVKGPDNAPVEGAKIRSYSDGFFQNSWQFGIQPQGPMTLATSGPDGRFQIPGLAPNDNTVLTASKPPLAGKPSKPFKVKADTPTPDVELVLEKGATVSGRVLDADGAPVVGANVQIYSQDGSGGNATETSAADGTFKMEGLPPGKYQLWCWSNTGGNAQKALDPALASGEVREGVELKMVAQKKGAKLSGTLVDEEGNAVAQSQISAQGANGSNAWAQTDLDGAFTFNGLAEGKVTISVQVMSPDGGYATNEPVANATFEAPGEGIKVVVTKKATITIAGRVLLPDGSPVPLCVLSTKASAGAGAGSAGMNGGMVYSMGPGGGSPGEVVNGEFRREVQLKAPFDVVISSPRDAEGRPLNLKSSTTKITESTTNLEIRLEGGLEIRGKVLGADGSPVVGAWVYAGTTNDRTIEDGSFRLVGLEGDEVSISVTPTEKYTSPAKPTKAKPGATDVLIRLDAGLAIVGRVVDPVGGPVLNAYVQVMGGTGGGRNQFGAQTDAQGAFKVENLPKDGVYDVTVQVWNDGSGKVANYKPWSKSGVKPGLEELFVRLEGGETIEGVVVDGDGKPVSGAWVNAQGVASGRGGGQGANTDEQGRFTCGGLDVGATYVLRAQQWNGTQRSTLPVRAEAGARGIKLVFAATTKLSGRLLGEGDKVQFNVVARPAGPLTPDADTTVANARTMADGTFSMEVPTDTLVDLYASKGNDDRYGFVGGVRAGGADVTIRIELGKSIEGTAEDAEGNPITQNAWLVASNDAWSGYGMVDGTGKWKVRGLPPGRYRIKLMNNSPGSKAPTAVEADTGATGVRIRLSG